MELDGRCGGMVMTPDDQTEATLAELTADRREEAMARFAVLKPQQFPVTG